MGRLIGFSYENWWLILDWNGETFPQLKRIYEKNIGITQNKLPFFNLMDNLRPISVWKQKNYDSRKYTYFSERCRPSSTIDIICISKNLPTKISKERYYQRLFPDHKHIYLTKNNFLDEDEQNFATERNNSK